MSAIADPLTRKLRLADSLSCKDALADWERLDTQISEALVNRVALDAQVRSLKAQADEQRDLVALTIEGKNEGERKGKLAQALLGDLPYQETLSQLREAERQLAVLDADVETWKRQTTRLKAMVGYRTEVLRFLAE